MNTLELARHYPEAFSALPEAYQNDDCLEFVDVDEGMPKGCLLCTPKKDQQNILGNWVCAFTNDNWTVIGPFHIVGNLEVWDLV